MFRQLEPFMWLTSQEAATVLVPAGAGQAEDTCPRPCAEPSPAAAIPEVTETGCVEPSGPDGLFWCFYIGHKGLAQYECRGRRAFAIAKETKLAAAGVAQAAARGPKGVATTARARATTESVHVELVGRPRLRYAGLRILCDSLGARVMYARRGCYVMLGPDEGPFALIMAGGGPSVIPEPTEAQIAAAKRDRIEVADCAKPLKAVSAYRLADLIRMCKAAGCGETVQLLDDAGAGKRPTKARLYMLLSSHLG